MGDYPKFVARATDFHTKALRWRESENVFKTIVVYMRLQTVFEPFWIRTDFGYVWIRLDSFKRFLDSSNHVFSLSGYAPILDTYGYAWIRLDTVVLDAFGYIYNAYGVSPRAPCSQ